MMNEWRNPFDDFPLPKPQTEDERLAEIDHKLTAQLAAKAHLRGEARLREAVIIGPQSPICRRAEAGTLCSRLGASAD
jgi:hypothetical protein